MFHHVERDFKDHFRYASENECKTADGRSSFKRFKEFKVQEIFNEHGNENSATSVDKMLSESNKQRPHS